MPGCKKWSAHSAALQYDVQHHQHQSFTLPARLGGAVTPPSAGKPSASRVDLQVLYFASGNRSFTSSMDMSFFSLLLLCGRGIAAKSIGSPFSLTARIARLRWLYLKQYLTPTMILGGICQWEVQ